MNINIILATQNQNKVKEINKMLDKTPFKLTSLKDLGFEEDIAEYGDTLEKNALIKARIIHDKYLQTLHVVL